MGTNISIAPKCSVHATAMLGFEESGKGRIILGRGTKVRPYAMLRTCGGLIQCGSGVNIGMCTVIHALGDVIIGDGTLISPHVGIYAQSHHIELGKPLTGKQVACKIEIGSNVWIGANAVIVGPVTIGSGSVIGAGVVVRENVPPNKIVVPDIKYKLIDRK